MINDQKTWKDLLFSSIERIKIIKMAILPKQSTDLIFPPIKIPRTRTNNPKIYMESLKTPKCQNNPKEKEQTGNITFPGFRWYCKATITKIVCYWSLSHTHTHKHTHTHTHTHTQLRYMDQWNRVEELRKKPIDLEQLIYDKGDKTT